MVAERGGTGLIEDIASTLPFDKGKINDSTISTFEVFPNGIILRDAITPETGFALFVDVNPYQGETFVWRLQKGDEPVEKKSATKDELRLLLKTALEQLYISHSQDHSPVKDEGDGISITISTGKIIFTISEIKNTLGGDAILENVDTS